MPQRPLLNPNQQRFVQHYTAGARGIRGNATAAYRAAGYHPKSEKVAGVNAARLLGNARIQAAVAQAHREADAAMIAQLKDWKTLAPGAQRTVMALGTGVLPAYDDPDVPEDERVGGARMLTRDDAAIGNVMLHASLAILERAYPLKLYADLTLHDPERLLATILGVSIDALPEPSVSTPYAPHNGHPTPLD